MSGRQHAFSRHNLEVSTSNNYYTSNAHAHSTPHRPHRSKRAIPDPSSSALGSSLSQLSLHDDLASFHSSLPSSPSTVSLASSLVDVRQLDSGVDLQEAPKPVNRRSNRDFRIIQPAEMEEFNLQESIRHSQTAHKPLPPKPQVFLNNNIVEDEDESYFGDILDKYCNSDDDIPSTKHTSVSRSSRPTTASATAGLTKSALPPTPTPAISRSQGAAAPSNETARDYHSFADRSSRERNESNRSGTHMREANSSASSSSMDASARFNTYLFSPARNSHESLTKSSSTASSASIQSTGTHATRAYTKKPPLPPKDKNQSQSQSSLYVSSSNASAPSLLPSGHYNSNPSQPTKESRPEPPPKDTSRRPHRTHLSTSTSASASSSINANNSSGRTTSTSTTSSQPPVLSFDTHTSDTFNSFADVVDATMKRHRASPSVSSTSSGQSYNPDIRNSSSRARSSSSQSQASTTRSSHKETGLRSSADRQEQTAYGQIYEQSYGRGGQGHTREHSQSQSNSQNGQSHRYHGQQHAQGYHSSQSQSHSQDNGHSRSRNQTQDHSQQHQPYSSSQGNSYRMHGSTSQLDLTGSTAYPSTASRPPAPSRSSSQQPSNQQPSSYVTERSRSYNHGSSISAASSSSSSRYHHGRTGTSRGLKSALVKTPIARARAKEAHGPRKVIFGDMITIVTVERAETPPPPPVLDKKARKKLLQAKKNASMKEGKKGSSPPQSFDPEYDAAYYNKPYFSTPAEVVVTQAPWIGNPNYDEEKANSKFYYDDDYEYDEDDEYGYDTPYESDLRLGPEDDDDDDEDEDEDEEDEDEEEYGARAWGHGIAGPGGALPKKKGGMFKFKRAVNKLFLN